MSKAFHNTFKFLDWSWQSNQLHLNYDLETVGVVTEVLSFPEFDKELFQSRKTTISKACDLLHWLCGVSYYKAGLAKSIQFQNKEPSKETAQFLQETWIHGLGELAYENQVSLAIQFPFDNDAPKAPSELKNKNRALLPFGGGKDSLVSLEQLKSMGKDFDLFMVGNAELMQKQAKGLNLNLVQVKRKIDLKLIEYNKQGAFNGHVPITSINSALAMLSALLLDYNAVIFSNERSADSPNVTLKDGTKINHQYSKSFEFESNFSELFKQEITPSIKYFSLQRPNSELQILKSFSQYPQYFKGFSSCNRNFHLQGSQNTNSLWCGDCPKCRFTFLGLAPFVTKGDLVEIFGSDLLHDNEQKQGFEELLGLSGIKPFECVGEIQECQIALQMISDRVDWQDSSLVKRLRSKVPQYSKTAIDKVFEPSLKHLIPKGYRL